MAPTCTSEILTPFGTEVVIFVCSLVFLLEKQKTQQPVASKRPRESPHFPQRKLCEEKTGTPPPPASVSHQERLRHSHLCFFVTTDFCSVVAKEEETAKAQRQKD